MLLFLVVPHAVKATPLLSEQFFHGLLNKLHYLITLTTHAWESIVVKLDVSQLAFFSCLNGSFSWIRQPNRLNFSGKQGGNGYFQMVFVSF